MKIYGLRIIGGFSFLKEPNTNISHEKLKYKRRNLMNKFDGPNEMRNYLLFMVALFGIVFMVNWVSQFFANPDRQTNREIAQLEKIIEDNCNGHPNLDLCQNDLKTFESYVRNKAIDYELILIDMGDIFHTDGYSRKELRRNLKEFYRLVSPKIPSKFNFKEMESLCILKGKEPDTLPNYLHNLMGLNEEEASEFLKSDGTNPFWRIKGHLVFEEESNEISLYSLDSCNLPATIPELTMESFSKFSLCEGYPYCLGVFWIELRLSNKEYLIKPSVEVKGFKFEEMSMGQLLDLKIEAKVNRKKASFLKLQELKTPML